MPLPEKVIERLERAPLDTPGWSGALFMFSVTVFFLALVIYAGITFGYGAYLDAQNESIKKEINNFSKRIPAAEQVATANFYSQLVNVRDLLGKHTATSLVFDWLEAKTMPSIYFSNLYWNGATQQMNLGGVARSVNDITDQIRVFQSQPEVSRVIITNVALNENLWRFDASVVFVPGFTIPGRQ